MSEGRIVIIALRLVPKNAYSRLVGWLARRRLPRALQRRVNAWFAGRYGANLDEAERPVADYPSLADFFTRRLKEGARTVDSDPDTLVSPADGKTLFAGPTVGGRALQVKGRDYSVAEFLVDDPLTAEIAAGSFVTVYLSPKDYHRVHSPVDGHVTGYLLVPGTLWPVNAAGVAHVDRLFCRNERLITFIDTPHHGTVAVAMVGATVVGKITVSYDLDAVTNRPGRSSTPSRVTYDEPKPIHRGDELGIFHMGSTVVVLSSRADLVAALPPHSPVRMGEPVLVSAR